MIAIHSEFDALPNGSQVEGVVERKEYVPGGPGHAEGHNCGPAAAIGALYGAMEAMKAGNLQGTLKFFGVPAEELLLARPYFVRDGYLDDVDIAMWCHVGSDFPNTYGQRSYAMMSVEYEFFGKTAHSAVSPWTGKSATDAVKLMDIGWDVLREHLRPTQRSHSVIVEGGVQPNVVPDYAKIWYFFRESDGDGVKELYEKASSIAKGACLMTGCTVKENVLSAIWPCRDNVTVAETISENVNLVGLPKWSQEEEELARRIQKAAGVKEVGLASVIHPLVESPGGTGSNDSGDITQVVPHGRVNFPSNVPGVPAHHWCAAIAEATSIAHKGEEAGAKVLAGTIIDFLTSPKLLEKAKKTFSKESEGISYRSLLPEGQKPDTTINEELMAKYRPLMEPFYLKKDIVFK